MSLAETPSRPEGCLLDVGHQPPTRAAWFWLRWTCRQMRLMACGALMGEVALASVVKLGHFAATELQHDAAIGAGALLVMSILYVSERKGSSAS